MACERAGATQNAQGGVGTMHGAPERLDKRRDALLQHAVAVRALRLQAVLLVHSNGRGH